MRAPTVVLGEKQCLHHARRTMRMSANHGKMQMEPSRIIRIDNAFAGRRINHSTGSRQNPIKRSKGFLVSMDEKKRRREIQAAGFAQGIF